VDPPLDAPLDPVLDPAVGAVPAPDAAGRAGTGNLTGIAATAGRAGEYGCVCP
jgi:hypothetical protein